MPFQKPWSSEPENTVFSLLKLISRMAIQPLQHNDYFADILTFLVMVVFPAVTPKRMGTELPGKCFGLKKKTPRHNSYGTNTRKYC
jgi:hypothetical protein